MTSTETHEVIPVSNFEEIPVDSIIRAYRRQETTQLRHRYDTLTGTDGTGTGRMGARILGMDVPSPPTPNLSDFTSSQDETLLNVARENNLDELVKNIGNEVILTARNRSTSVRRCSTRYKIYEGILRALIAIMGIASAALSINGLNNLSGKEIEETFLFIVGIIVICIPILTEFKDRMNFKIRSTKLREFHNKYEEKIRRVRQIMVSELTPFEALDQIYQIETTLNELDLKAFDQHFSKEPEEENFVACTTKHRCVVPRQNATIFTSSDGPVDGSNEIRLNIKEDTDSSDSE